MTREETLNIARELTMELTKKEIMKREHMTDEEAVNIYFDAYAKVIQRISEKYSPETITKYENRNLDTSKNGISL